LEPEKDSASPPRSSLWPLALLGTAVALLSLRKPPTQSDKKNYKTVPQEDSTDSKDNTAPQHVEFVSDTIPSPQHTNYPDGGKKHTPGWEKAAVVVAILILSVNAWQSWETRKSAGAAKSAAETASKQLEAADRPWIKDTVRSAFDFTANNGAFSWAVTIRAENLGHSVATAIFPETRLIAIHGADFIDAPRQQAKELCDNVSKRFETVKDNPSVWGTSIFPGEWSEFASNAILWPSQIKGNTFDGGAKLGTSVFPVLIGCIEYHYATSEKPHHTWFVYTLVHNEDSALAEPTRVFFSLGKTIPNKNMVLIKASQFAD